MDFKKQSNNFTMDLKGRINLSPSPHPVDKQDSGPTFNQSSKIPKPKYERTAATASPLNTRSQPMPQLGQKSTEEGDKNNGILESVDSPRFVKH